MKTIKTTVSYKVSEGHYCNISEKSAEKCRFCVKDKYGYRCALYNMPLDTHETVYVLKTRECEKAKCGFPSIVTAPATPKVEPKQIMKMTIDEFLKIKKQLVAQGYPASMAETLAKKMVMEEN